MRATTTMLTVGSGTTTGLQTLDQGWQDVDAWRNLGLLFLASVILQVDPGLLYTELPPRLASLLADDFLTNLRDMQRELLEAERAGKTKRAERLKNRFGREVRDTHLGALKGHRVTLFEYNDVLGAMRRILGHASHLRRVGACSRYIAFGADAVKKVATDWGLRLVTSPAMVYSALGEGSDLWNSNKGWDAERIASGHWRLYTWYLPGTTAGVEARDPMDDWWSLYHLIRGMNQELPAMFTRNPNGALEVSYKVAQLPLVDLIESELPGVTLELRNGQVFLVGPDMSEEAYGTVVWLRPDERGLYIGDYDLEPTGDGSVMGVLLNQDVCSRSVHPMEDGEMLPLLDAGEIYMLDSQQGMVPYTVTEVRWKPNLGDLVPLHLVKGMAEEVRREHSGAHARAALVSVQRRLALANALIQAGYPNVETALDVSERVQMVQLGREAETHWSQRDIVLFVDVVGSETIQRRMQSGEIARRVQAMFDGMREVAARYGAWLYKEMGDGAVFVLTDGFGAVGECDNEGVGLQKLAHNALHMSQELAQVVRRELDAEIRIGIDYGENTWRIQGTGLLEVTGIPTTRAARLESCGRPGAVLVSPEFRELANGGIQFFTGPDQFTIKHGRQVTAFTYMLPETRVRELSPAGDIAIAK